MFVVTDRGLAAPPIDAKDGQGRRVTAIIECDAIEHRPGRGRDAKLFLKFAALRLPKRLTGFHMAADAVPAPREGLVRRPQSQQHMISPDQQRADQSARSLSQPSTRPARNSISLTSSAPPFATHASI